MAYWQILSMRSGNPGKTGFFRQTVCCIIAFMNLVSGRITMSLRQISLLFFSLLVLAIFLSACGGSTSTPTVTAITATPVLQTPTPTAVPARPLTICVGQEPASLFPINNSSTVARAILAAVYEGPIDTNSYEYQPV